MIKGNVSKTVKLLLLAAVVSAVASRLFIRCEALSSALYLITIPLILYCMRESGTVREYLTVFFAEFICGYARYCTDFGETLLAMTGMAFVSFFICFLRTLVFAADCHVMKKKECFASTLMFPLLTCFLEFLLDRMAFGNALNPATCLYSFLPVLQVTRVIPEYVLLFLLTWFISLLVYMIRGKKFSIPSFAACLLILVIFVVPGSIILSKAPDTSGRTVRVAFFTAPECLFYEESGPTSAEDMERFREAVRKASEEGADLMMSVEEQVIVNGENLEEALRAVSSAAGEEQIYVIAGFEVLNGDEKKDNIVYVFDRDGNIICRYQKNLLVPFIEAPFFNEGDGKLGRFTLNAGGEEYNAAVCICFDGNCGTLTGQARKETDILFMPAWEWNTVNLDQPRNNRVIPVRQDVTLIKAAQDGYHMALDRWGRTIYKEDTVGKYLEFSIADIPIYQ